MFYNLQSIFGANIYMQGGLFGQTFFIENFRIIGVWSRGKFQGL